MKPVIPAWIMVTFNLRNLIIPGKGLSLCLFVCMYVCMHAVCLSAPVPDPVGCWVITRQESPLSEPVHPKTLNWKKRMRL